MIIFKRLMSKVLLGYEGKKGLDIIKLVLI